MKIKLFFSQIRNKLRLISYIVVAMLLIIGALIFYVTDDINKNNQFAPLYKIESNFLILQNNVRDFILHDSKTSEFIQSGISHHSTICKNEFTEIDKTIKLIRLDNRQLGLITNANLMKLDTIQQNINQLKKIYNQVELLFRKKGNESSGLINSLLFLNQKMKSEFPYVENPEVKALLISFLHVDFLYSERKDEIQNIIKINQELLRIVSDSTNALEPSFTPQVRHNLQISLSTYLQQVDELYQTNKEIGIYGFGNYEKLLYLESKIIQDIKYLKEQVSIEIESQARKNSILLLLLILFFSAITLISISYIQSSIVTPLETIKNYTKQIALGKFPEKIYFSQQDEITAILKYVNYLVDGLKQKDLFAKQIGLGNLDAQVMQLSESDTLSQSLKEMQNSLKQAHVEREKRQEEERQQKWINKGIAEFASILRQSNENLHKLGDDVIRSLIHYVDANQGGIFLYHLDQDNQPFMELIASYAYDRKKFTSKKIEIGEGLIGSIALEQKMIHLHKLPSDYLEITSGLGEAQPSDLVIIPLLFNDIFYGALEIAAFEKLDDYKIEFLKIITDNIASTFASVKVNMQTTKLLEQSNIQAEELASQEEEMRQNMEELQATQEEASRRELALQELVNSINAANFVIEYDATGRITAANKIVEETLELTQDQILNKSVFDFVDNFEETSALWERVLRGNIIKQIGRIKINQKEHWFNETYSPIKDEDGVITKVLKFAVDITETKNLEKKIHEENLIIRTQEQMMNQKLHEFSLKEEELLKTKTEINEIKKTIDSSLYYAELNEAMYFTNINQRFLAALGYNENELINQKHDFISIENEKNTSNIIVEQLKQFGVFKTRAYKLTKAKQSMYLFLTYSIITDGLTNKSKIILFAHEVLE